LLNNQSFSIIIVFFQHVMEVNFKNLCSSVMRSYASYRLIPLFLFFFSMLWRQILKIYVPVLCVHMQAIV
jgi:hypothetical protein